MIWGVCVSSSTFEGSKGPMSRHYDAFKLLNKKNYALLTRKIGNVYHQSTFFNKTPWFQICVILQPLMIPIDSMIFHTFLVASEWIAPLSLKAVQCQGPNGWWDWPEKWHGEWPAALKFWNPKIVIRGIKWEIPKTRGFNTKMEEHVG